MEALTLELAEKWGADVIRDSDGTRLSDEILQSGYGIYSTICIIRDHNEWAAKHPECLQQTFLSTPPATACGGALEIGLLDSFFAQQFRINDGAAAMAYWQVWDRTANRLLPADSWQYDPARGRVILPQPEEFHNYTVSFLAYRIWEEISMYNHVTNSWDKEHLVPLDPRHPEVQQYLYDWFRDWCEQHPHTTVVRFTSMFYNFVWIWGASEKNRNLFSDWASYDFTVSEGMLQEFERQYGYALTAEDFINKGDLHVTHMPPDAHKKDYMQFVQQFVAEYGSKLVRLVQSFGKKAYVFYDDSWVGVEPSGERFPEFGFDGVIKCVFSGYEVRLCAEAPAHVHELRLHPYLFPVGLGGAPTFMEGGDPTRDAKQYWNQVRRALLRVKIDRIGLGGYLHLVEDFPDFVDYIQKVADEFRTIRSFHESGEVYTLPLRVAVLHSWGSLRPWTLSGHFHETYMHDLIHINEALSGLPVQVKFISFEDVHKGALEDTDVVINAGRAGTAWSGGEAWGDPQLVEALTGWVYRGGMLLGVGEPSALAGYGEYFRMAHVLGVDKDTGARVCHGRWSWQEQPVEDLLPAGAGVKGMDNLMLTGPDTRVLATDNGLPALTAHPFGKGMGIYMGGFQVNNANTRMLLNLLLWSTGRQLQQPFLTDDPDTECAWYPASRSLVVINNSETARTARVDTGSGVEQVKLEGYDTAILQL